LHKRYVSDTPSPGLTVTAGAQKFGGRTSGSEVKSTPPDPAHEQVVVAAAYGIPRTRLAQ